MNRCKNQSIVYEYQCCENYWKVAEYHMLISKGKDLNQFQAPAKGDTKVNLRQRCYRHIGSTSESEAWRKIHQQPKELNYSPMQRRDGGKLGKEEEEQQEVKNY